MASIALTSVDTRVAHCRSCGARIRWARTAAGKAMPLDAAAKPQRLATGGYQVDSEHTHWATCPTRDQHRREQRTAPSERID